MREITRRSGVVLAMVLATSAAACAQAADPSPAVSPNHAPALLAEVPGGDVATLDQAIAADLRARLAEMFGPGGQLGGFEVRWDNAVCHEAAPLWTEPPPVGVCFVLAVAVNVGASYAVIVPAEGPVGFALLELVVE